MKLYVGIDVHASNNVVAIINEEKRVIHKRRIRNELAAVQEELAAYKGEIEGVVVESTYNWYWIVDGLQEAGYRVHLANTSAIKQYEGLKYSDDKADAIHLAELLRLGILPKGYIYPKEERAVRDLMRKRSQLVRQRTANVLSASNIVARQTGMQMKGQLIARGDVFSLIKMPMVAKALTSNLRVVECLNDEIGSIERAVEKEVKRGEEYRLLSEAPGIGKILALTIGLETGDIGRFRKVGNYASYCRCVDSKKTSNGKLKGRGNTKNGNPYLAWAYMEAASYAIRYYGIVRAFYERKAARKPRVVALKATAHKLARGCYYVLRDKVPFDYAKAFKGVKTAGRRNPEIAQVEVQP
jgi:transposase